MVGIAPAVAMFAILTGMLISSPVIGRCMLREEFQRRGKIEGVVEGLDLSQRLHCGGHIVGDFGTITMFLSLTTGTVGVPRADRGRRAGGAGPGVGRPQAEEAPTQVRSRAFRRKTGKVPSDEIVITARAAARSGCPATNNTTASTLAMSAPRIVATVMKEVEEAASVLPALTPYP